MERNIWANDTKRAGFQMGFQLSCLGAIVGKDNDSGKLGDDINY